MMTKVRETVTKNRMLSPGDRVVVAVSGGPDSVALLQALRHLTPTYDLHMTVAHLEHGLRGPEGEEDARFVRQLAEGWGLTCDCRTLDPGAIRPGGGRSLEDRAREARYAFLAETARRRGAGRIALGHHRLDQAETVLMNLLRGAGTGGLKGMRPVREGLYIRPLLSVSKKEILAFLKEEGLGFVTDRSNETDAPLRNRIRRHLIPHLQASYNPALEENLSHLAEIMGQEDDFLQEAVAGWLQERPVRQADGAFRLPLADLREAHPALRNRIIKTLLQDLRGDAKGITFRHIRSVGELIKSNRPGGRAALPGGIEARRVYETLILSPRRLPSLPSFHYPVVLPGSVCVAEADMTLRFDLLDGGAMDLDSRGAACLDLQQIVPPLCLRSFREGDRIQPLGMAGTKKLKALFIDRKIPVDGRRAIPLLVDQLGVLWVPGLALCHRVRVTEGSTRLLKVEIV